MGNTLRFSLVVGAIDEATAPIRRINQTINALAAAPRAVGSAIGRLASEIGLATVARRGAAVGSSLRFAAGEAGALGLKLGALAGLSGGGLFGLVKGAADYGEKTLMASQRLNMSTASFQRNSFAAGQSSVATESFADAMRFLSANAVEAATGSEEAAQWFRAAGVQIKDAQGKIKGTDVLFLELADAFEKSDKGAEKIKIAMALLGRSGTDLIPVLNSGSKEIRRLGDEAARLGIVIGDDAIKQAEAFGDRLDVLGRVVRTVGFSVGSLLIPVIEPLIIRTTEWVAANRELVAVKVQEYVGQIVDAIPSLVAGAENVAAGLSGVVGIARWLGDTFGYTETAAVAIGLYLGGPLIGALTNVAIATTLFATSIGGVAARLTLLAFAPVIAAVGNFVVALQAGYGAMAAFNLVLAANPIGVVMVAVAALAGAAYLIYQNWEPISQFFSNLWDGLVSFVSGLDPLLLLGPFGVAARMIIDNWTPISAFFDGLIGGIVTKFNSLVDLLPDFVKRQLGVNVGVSGSQLGPPIAGGTGGARGQNFEGELVIRLEGAPSGTRVERLQSNSPGMDIGLDLGTTMVMP